MFRVPVVNENNEPLMPTTLLRARRWINIGKATPFWNKGVFCVRLNIPTQENKQNIVVGIDPGNKKEAFTVKSKAYTFLNIQADAVTWVKEAVEARRNARKARRYRKTPCRQPRFNRKRGSLVPSTKARWQWKLRILNWLKKIFPITCVIVEDIKAKSTGKKRWDKSFSPLEVGKNWFYGQISNLILKQGWETKELRDKLGLNKTSNKLSKSFDAHCVDSWVLANDVVGGHNKPDNKEILYIRPLRFHRRQLHVFCPAKGGKRKRHGSLVRHKELGLCYVGGTRKGRISLHILEHGERLGQNFKVEDCKFLTFSSWVC
jgi:hypothetical protein